MDASLSPSAMHWPEGTPLGAYWYSRRVSPLYSMSSLPGNTPAVTAVETGPSFSGVQSWAELVVLAAAMTTLLPDTVSVLAVTADSLDGLAHQLPHAVVDAPADSRLSGISPAAIAAAAATDTVAFLEIFTIPPNRYRRYAPLASVQVNEPGRGKDGGPSVGADYDAKVASMAG